MKSKKQVVVLVPVYKPRVTKDEQVSLLHLARFLSDYPITVVAPASLTIEDIYLNSLQKERFADHFFSGIPGYNRLMLSREFYERFANFEYILIYQLDCLVFSDNLSYWCSKEWDYVGAPWFANYSQTSEGGLWAVGNGGLSLRRVPKFLEVLNSTKPGKLPPLNAPTRFDFNVRWVQVCVRRMKQYLYSRGYKNNVNWVKKNSLKNEDHFWSFNAVQYVDSFRIPSPREALAFSIEYAPRECFAMAGGKLPFGCHAWRKAGPEFWKTYMIEPPGTLAS